MGQSASPRHVARFLAALEQILAAMGAEIETGVGAAAAEKALAAG
jgi:aspartate aminotransferase-like enzyme